MYNTEVEPDLDATLNSIMSDEAEQNLLAASEPNRELFELSQALAGTTGFSAVDLLTEHSSKRRPRRFTRALAN